MLGTIGASFYLLGVGYLYAATGTLNMGDLSLRLSEILESRTVLSGVVFLLMGLAIKMALVPLHGWLPDAYAHAPEPICPIVAALMTKVALYALVRITFWVLGIETIFGNIPFMVYLGWIGAIATLAGALLALSEKNIKRMFAYGGLSHVGLVVLGISLGNKTGYTGGIFYLLNDAVMQAGLFFIAGTLIYRYGVKNVSDLTQIGGKMPWTVTALIVTALSMVGIPPTGGFFGKWYLVLGALEIGNYLAVAVIIVGTLLTLAFFIKILEKMLFEERQAPKLPGLEAPFPMRLGMGMVVVSILVLGIFSDPTIQLIQNVALPSGF
jgi:multicomponent Na+:H+ antiporter subunit D